jgi:hypothetical protein
MVETLPSNVDRVLAIVHPNPANKTLVEQRLNDYETKPWILDGRDFDVVSTERTLEGTIEMLKKEARPGTQLDLMAGDGSYFNKYTAMSMLGLVNRSTTGGGGGACDVAHMINPFSSDQFSPWASMYSPAIEHQPLLVTAEHKDIPVGDRRRLLLAVAYFSIGFTADVSARFNDDDFRHKLDRLPPSLRLARQGVEISKRVIRPGQTKQFEVEDEKGERTLSELAFSNGEQMASQIKFKDLKLMEPGYGRLEVEGKLDPSAIVGAIRRARKGNFDKFDGRDESNVFVVSSQTSDTIIAEANGEIFSYPSGTQFTVVQGTPNRLKKHGLTPVSMIYSVGHNFPKAA